jgi:hypothetical protein
MRKKRKKPKNKLFLISLILLSYFQVHGQSDTLEIELNWNNENIKYLTGKITVSDSSVNLFYGKSLIGNKEHYKTFLLKVPIPTIDKKIEYKIEINLNQFYKEKIHLSASNELNRIVLFLNEYPSCELRRIEKRKKRRFNQKQNE